MNPPSTASPLSDSELEVSYWYITHQQILYRVILVVLGLIGFCSLAYVGWTLVDYGMNYQRERQQLASSLLVDSTGLVSDINARYPKRLNIDKVDAIPNGSGGYDLLAQISNPNTDWLARFDYQLAGDTILRRGFVLPRSTSYLTILGVADAGRSFEVVDQSWERIDQAQTLVSQRLQFAISEPEFIPSGTATGVDDQVNFTVTNQSAFNYWDAHFVVMLYDGSVLVRVDSVKVDQFKSGETRPVKLLVGSNNYANIRVEVVPLVDVLSQTNLMPFAAGDIIDILEIEKKRGNR